MFGGLQTVIQFGEEFRPPQIPAPIPRGDPSRIEHIDRISGTGQADVNKPSIPRELLWGRITPGEAPLVQPDHDHHIIVAFLRRLGARHFGNDDVGQIHF